MSTISGSYSEAGLEPCCAASAPDLRGAMLEKDVAVIRGTALNVAGARPERRSWEEVVRVVGVAACLRDLEAARQMLRPTNAMTGLDGRCEERGSSACVESEHTHAHRDKPLVWKRRLSKRYGEKRSFVDYQMLLHLRCCIGAPLPVGVARSRPAQTSVGNIHECARGNSREAHPASSSTSSLGGCLV